MKDNIFNRLSSKKTKISENNAYTELYKNLIEKGYGNKQISFSRLGDIEKYLPYFKGRSLTLYIFYLSKAKNDTGVSYWSIQRIANELKTSTKSITNWNSNLIELGLIYRQNDTNIKTSSKTYLLPTQSFIIPIKNDYNAYSELLSTTKYTQRNSYSIELETKEFINYIVFIKKTKISEKPEIENKLNNYIILENKTNKSISKAENTILQEYINKNTDQSTTINKMNILMDMDNLSKEKIDIIIAL